MPRALLLIAALCLLQLAPASASAAPRLTSLEAFDEGVFVTAPPGDGQRLFVVERAGRIRVMRDGNKLPTPFLDIASSVRSSGGEQGLLSMAFAPDYATSRRFYVYYTAPRAGDAGGSVLTVAEFQASAANPDVADPASRRVIYTVDHPTNDNHNGGQLQFGPDGLLYAATGDGGSRDDPSNNAQNPASRLGKILRVNPLQAAAPEIVASGLRNPWRFSFDRATGDMTLADVGQGEVEEVNFAPRGELGQNFGWRCYEGSADTPGVPNCEPPGHVKPVIDHLQSSGWCAIVGGYVVRDPALPSLLGKYVHGDNCKSDIYAATLARPTASGVGPTGLRATGVTSLGEDSCGHVYVLTFERLYRIDEGAYTACPVLAPPPGPGTGAVPDTRAPAVRLTGSKRQRALRTRSFLVGAGCDELCTVTGRGRVKIQGSRRAYRLRAVTRRSLAAGVRTKLYLRASPTVMRALRAGVRRKRRIRADIVVTGRDAAGNARAVKRTIRLRR